MSLCECELNSESANLQVDSNIEMTNFFSQLILVVSVHFSLFNHEMREREGERGRERV